MLADVLRLVRAPLAATAIADGLTGYLLATVRLARAQGDYSSALPHETVRDPRWLLLAAAASTSLYWAGMALNDFFDLERDRKQYPFRPLPSGKVSPRFAVSLGLALLLVGVALAFLGGGRNGALAAGFTAAAILSYDGLLKRWRLPGSFAMGACRTGNVLLGAQVALAHAALGPETELRLYLPYALAIGIYVFSLTLLSTLEDEDGRAPAIGLGFLGAVAVPIALGYVFRAQAAALALFGAHAALVLALDVRTMKLGTKAAGHATTRWLLRGLLLLDAGALAGAGLLPWAGGVLALIVPNLVGAKLLFGRPPQK